MEAVVTWEEHKNVREREEKKCNGPLYQFVFKGFNLWLGDQKQNLTPFSPEIPTC